MIQGASFHVHKHFVRANHWVGRVGKSQYLRPAVRIKDNCFHETSGLLA
jgi:hypothetical protein